MIGVVQTRAVFAAAILYSVWLVSGLFIDTGLSVKDSYVSELSALTASYGWVFRMTDTMAGIILLVLTVNIVSVDPAVLSRISLASLGLVGLAFFSAMTILDALNPLDCQISVDRGCALAEDRGELSASHKIHTIASVCAGVGQILSLLLSMVLPTGRARAVALTFATITALSTVAVGVSFLNDAAYIGYAQRLQLLAYAGWIVAWTLGARQVSRPTIS